MYHTLVALEITLILKKSLTFTSGYNKISLLQNYKSYEQVNL
jgi:hypothetical protein